MSNHFNVKEYAKNANKKFNYFPIKDQNEFENMSFYMHQTYEYSFNGSIGAPVHKKLQAGAKVLEFGCENGVWTIEAASEYPNSKFYAVDFTAPISTDDDNITFISCDIHQKLPFSDNEFDYVFSRNQSNFFKKDKFQGFLFEIFRVLKPEGWLEIVHTLLTECDSDCGPAFARMNDAYILWCKENGIDFDLVIHLEDYLKMTGKAEFISSQIVKIPTGGDGIGEFSCNVSLYYLKLMKEFFAPHLGISIEEYDRKLCEVENELKKKCATASPKRVIARKKDLAIKKV
ncbi:23382_t:CDS:2 [Gigaspora margarita]|uniref:23382_t:CDS:1 n=1 Tax=Gigaspora margarita TaxID=4874 RepID=A0ABN7V252_GIGMA|nr:23382_t:CDS:2 [Gigaspora margarita]